MFQNHFQGNGNNYYIIQVVIHPPDNKKIDEPKKTSKSFGDRVKSFFSMLGDIAAFIKKAFPLIPLLLTSC